jgi:hypothetical protein
MLGQACHGSGVVLKRVAIAIFNFSKRALERVEPIVVGVDSGGAFEKWSCLRDRASADLGLRRGELQCKVFRLFIRCPRKEPG